MLEWVCQYMPFTIFVVIDPHYTMSECTITQTHKFLVCHLPIWLNHHLTASRPFRELQTYICAFVKEEIDMYPRSTSVARLVSEKTCKMRIFGISQFVICNWCLSHLAFVLFLFTRVFAGFAPIEISIDGFHCPALRTALASGTGQNTSTFPSTIKYLLLCTFYMYCCVHEILLKFAHWLYKSYEHIYQCFERRNVAHQQSVSQCI